MKQKLVCKNFDQPDEVREFPNGRVELVKLGPSTVVKAIFEAGWRWSESVQPLAGTKSCLASHLQFHLSGVLHVVMDDGTEKDCYPGDVVLLPEGHDAWTVGDEAVVIIDFHGMLHYAERQQARAEKSLHRLTMESPIPTLIQDGLEGKGSIRVNQRFQEILGYSSHSMSNVSTFWQKMIPDEAYRQKVRKLWQQRLDESIESRVEAIEIHATCHDNSKRIFDVHLTQTDNQCIAVFVDLTEQYQLKDYLSYAALHDELTEILNRRGYNQAVGQAWRLSTFSHTTLALFMIDIDHFKQYNDVYGHRAGDECLKRVASTLKRELRRSGDIVARIGGEEFVVLMQNTSKEGAISMAETMRTSIEALNIPHTGSLTSDYVTVSIGLISGCHYHDIHTHEQLLEAADKRLYQAKQQGRNRVVTQLATE